MIDEFTFITVGGHCGEVSITDSRTRRSSVIKCRRNGVAYGFFHIRDGLICVGWNDGIVSFVKTKDLEIENVKSGENALRCFGFDELKNIVVGAGDDGDIWSFNV
jgi:hypothetical protein